MKRSTALLVAIVFGCLVIANATFAQKGLYLGAGVGYSALGGDYEPEFDGGTGVHFVLGYKPGEKVGLEVELGAYNQEVLNKNSRKENAAFGGLAANLKYFFGPARRHFVRPYIVCGLGMNNLTWDYKEGTTSGGIGGDVAKDDDAVRAFSLMPGLGSEILFGKFIALNGCIRLALNAWSDKSVEGQRLYDKAPNSHGIILNAGVLLHL